MFSGCKSCKALKEEIVVLRSLISDRDAVLTALLEKTSTERLELVQKFSDLLRPSSRVKQSSKPSSTQSLPGYRPDLRPPASSSDSLVEGSGDLESDLF